MVTRPAIGGVGGNTELSFGNTFSSADLDFTKWLELTPEMGPEQLKAAVEKARYEEAAVRQEQEVTTRKVDLSNEITALRSDLESQLSQLMNSDTLDEEAIGAIKSSLALVNEAESVINSATSLSMLKDIELSIVAPLKTVDGNAKQALSDAETKRVQEAVEYYQEVFSIAGPGGSMDMRQSYYKESREKVREILGYETETAGALNDKAEGHFASAETKRKQGDIQGALEDEAKGFATHMIMIQNGILEQQGIIDAASASIADARKRLEANPNDKQAQADLAAAEARKSEAERKQAELREVEAEVKEKLEEIVQDTENLATKDADRLIAAGKLDPSQRESYITSRVDRVRSAIETAKEEGKAITDADLRKAAKDRAQEEAQQLPEAERAAHIAQRTAELEGKIAQGDQATRTLLLGQIAIQAATDTKEFINLNSLERSATEQDSLTGAADGQSISIADMIARQRKQAEEAETSLSGAAAGKPALSIAEMIAQQRKAAQAATTGEKDEQKPPMSIAEMIAQQRKAAQGVTTGEKDEQGVEVANGTEVAANVPKQDVAKAPDKAANPASKPQGGNAIA